MANPQVLLPINLLSVHDFHPSNNINYYAFILVLNLFFDCIDMMMIPNEVSVFRYSQTWA